MNRNNNKTFFRRFTAGDALIMVFLSAAAFFSFKSLDSLSPSTMKVYRDSKLVSEYPLDNERLVTIKGAEGPIIVKISDGSVAVIDANCRNKICMRSGKIDKPFQQIICAPNHVLIEITNSTKHYRTDAIAE